MSEYSPNKKYETINYYGGKFRDVCGAYTGYGYCYISENGLIIKGYFRQGYCKYGEITYPNDVIIKGSIRHNTRESSIIDILFIRYDKPFEIRIDYDKSADKNNNYKSVSYNVNSDEYVNDDSEEDDNSDYIDDPGDDSDDNNSDDSEEDKKDDHNNTTKNSIDIVSMKEKYMVTEAEIKNVVYYSPDEKIRLHGDNIIYVDEKCSIKRGTFINNQFVKGDILYKNGDISSGEFNQHERLIGKGVSIETNSIIYTGTFNDGLLCGNGTIETTYGEFRNGIFDNNLLHGKGISIFRGNVHEGTFIRGYLNEGKITRPNNDLYEGKFVRNQLIKGKKTTNKNIYNGEYNDKGYLVKGRIYNKYTRYTYEGDFKDHQLYGQGKVWRNKKLIKEGEFYAGVLATGIIYKYNSNGTFNTYDTTGKLIQDNSDPTQYIMQQKIDILFDFVDQLQMQNQHLQQQIDDLQHYINDT